MCGIYRNLGRIVDQACEPLIATHACKCKVRYRYYVSRSFHYWLEGAAAGMRLPAREIEALVADEIAGLLDDALALATQTGMSLTPDDLPVPASRCAEISAQPRTPSRRPMQTGWRSSSEEGSIDPEAVA